MIFVDTPRDCQGSREREHERRHTHRQSTPTAGDPGSLAELTLAFGD